MRTPAKHEWKAIRGQTSRIKGKKQSCPGCEYYRQLYLHNDGEILCSLCSRDKIFGTHSQGIPRRTESHSIRLDELEACIVTTQARLAHRSNLRATLSRLSVFDCRSANSQEEKPEPPPGFLNDLIFDMEQWGHVILPIVWFIFIPVMILTPWDKDTKEHNKDPAPVMRKIEEMKKRIPNYSHTYVNHGRR